MITPCPADDRWTDEAQIAITLLELRLRRLQRAGQALLDALGPQAYLSNDLQTPAANMRAAIAWRPTASRVNLQ